MTDHARTPWYVLFDVFLRLGLTSFGGPVAHLGYMQRECVTHQRWLDEAQFAQLVAVCQLLPGPASSQLGFGIGLLRGGWRGAVAAFAGFTLPSVLLLFFFAVSVQAVSRAGAAELVDALQHGFGLVAVAVVAHAVVRLARLLTPDVQRLIIAGLVAAVMLLARSAMLQLAMIAAGALLGLVMCRGSAVKPLQSIRVPFAGRTAWLTGSMFAVLLALAVAWPAFAEPNAGGRDAAGAVDLGAAFYRAGALVFGGGHVVLPLLEVSLVDSGWLSTGEFFSGYGAAQAVPGPLFSVAALFGAQAASVSGELSLVGAAVGIAGIFLPGFLLLITVLPLWQRISAFRWAPPALAGINAAVVGLLAAALYNPVITTAVRSVTDVIIAALATVFLLRVSRSPLWAVAWCVGATVLARTVFPI